MGGDETVPFMKPLEEARMEELTAAEKAWSGWLAMEDWMVGPRAPQEESGAEASRYAPVASPAVGGHMPGNPSPGVNLPDGVGEAFQQQRSPGYVSVSEHNPGLSPARQQT